MKGGIGKDIAGSGGGKQGNGIDINQFGKLVDKIDKDKLKTMDIPAFLLTIIGKDFEGFAKTGSKALEKIAGTLKGAGGVIGFISLIIDGTKFALGKSSKERFATQVAIWFIGNKYPVAGLSLSMGESFLGDKIESKIRDEANKYSLPNIQLPNMRDQFYQAIGFPDFSSLYR